MPFSRGAPQHPPTPLLRNCRNACEPSIALTEWCACVCACDRCWSGDKGAEGPTDDGPPSVARAETRKKPRASAPCVCVCVCACDRCWSGDKGADGPTDDGPPSVARAETRKKPRASAPCVRLHPRGATSCLRGTVSSSTERPLRLLSPRDKRWLGYGQAFRLQQLSDDGEKGIPRALPSGIRREERKAKSGWRGLASASPLPSGTLSPRSSLHIAPWPTVR
jgi:hypothetical protein